MTIKAQDRDGVCSVCGNPVAAHFDKRERAVPIGPKYSGAQSSQFLTRAQITDRLGISRWTWRKWVTCGEAPAPVSGLPGLPKWRVTDIDRFESGGRRFFRSHQRSAKQRVSRKLSLVHDIGSVKEAGDVA